MKYKKNFLKFITLVNILKAQDVITQLYTELPKHTDLFSNTIAITSLTQISGTATVTTAIAHGLTTGDAPTIVGAETDAPIITLTRTTTTLFVETSIDHDLTFNPKIDTEQFIEIEGAAESEFNGTFKLTRVTNRRNFELLTVDSGATVATGSPVAIDIVKFGYNGLISVTVTGATTFTYIVNSTVPSPAGGVPVLHAGIRVTGVVTAERIISLYTEQPPTDFWAFVVLNDVVASKDRNVSNDAVTAQVGSTFRNQKLIQNFSVFVVAPADTELAARLARDTMEDVAVFLYSSLLGVQFSSGFHANKKWLVTALGHSFQFYNTAFYIHEFAFEMLAQILFEDSVGRPFDVAFRDMDITFNPSNVGVEPMTATIDLDEVAL